MASIKQTKNQRKKATHFHQNTLEFIVNFPLPLQSVVERIAGDEKSDLQYIINKKKPDWACELLYLIL